MTSEVQRLIRRFKSEHQKPEIVRQTNKVAVLLADHLAWPKESLPLPRNDDGLAEVIRSVDTHGRAIELTTSEHLILISYATPVAFRVRGTSQVYILANPPSRTSDRHIKIWLRQMGDPSEIDVEQVTMQDVEDVL